MFHYQITKQLLCILLIGNIEHSPSCSIFENDNKIDEIQCWRFSLKAVSQVEFVSYQYSKSTLYLWSSNWILL